MPDFVKTKMFLWIMGVVVGSLMALAGFGYALSCEVHNIKTELKANVAQIREDVAEIKTDVKWLVKEQR